MAQVTNPYVIDNINKNYNSYAETKEKPLVNLSYYAQKNIDNYMTITELPQENIDYLKSVRGTDMNHMFYDCNRLTTLDVSKWDTSQVTDMSSMFYKCGSLTTLDVSKWDTSQVTSTNHMFNSCNRLTTLDVSKWDTSQVTNMGSMFVSCGSLTTLTGTIDMSSCTYCNYMFDDCNNLKGVHLKNVPSSLNVSWIGGINVSLDTLIANGTVIVDNYI